MHKALLLAREAARYGEIPVGAVIVRNMDIIATGRNTNRVKKDPTLHAEMTAIREACRVTGNERLNDCILYVTKEPCAMCAGAIVHARIEEVYIGTADPRYGACGSALDVCGNPALNHVPKITIGILQQESASLLSSFFKELRKG